VCLFCESVKVSVSFFSVVIMGYFIKYLDFSFFLHYKQKRKREREKGGIPRTVIISLQLCMEYNLRGIPCQWVLKKHSIMFKNKFLKFCFDVLNCNKFPLNLLFVQNLIQFYPHSSEFYYFCCYCCYYCCC
jgi:hypothetical protein